MPIQSVFKSFKQKNLIEIILQQKTELKRDPLIIGQLNATNIFTMDQYVVEEPKKEPVKKIEV